MNSIKHNQLQEEEQQKQSSGKNKSLGNSKSIESKSQKERSKKLTQDEIIAQISKEAKNGGDRKPGNRLQRFMMVGIFFSIQGLTLKILCDSSSIPRDLSNFTTLMFWLEVVITLISYLVVAFKDPGYVTSYVLRGDDYEDDLEQAKREVDDNSKYNDIAASKKKNKKVKRAILSTKGKNIIRSELLTSKNGAIPSLPTQQANIMTTQNNTGALAGNQGGHYSAVMDQSSLKCTPTNRNNGKFLFSNMTTNMNNELANQNESYMNYPIIEETSFHYNNKSLKDKKKVIVQIQKGSSRQTNSQNQQNNNNFLDIHEDDSQLNHDGDIPLGNSKMSNIDQQQSKFNPFEMISKRLAAAAQNSNKSQQQESENDISGKTTQAFTYQGKKTQLLERDTMKSDEFITTQNNIMSSVGKITEEEVNRKRKQMKHDLLNNEDFVEELDSDSKQYDRTCEGSKVISQGAQLQFYPIQEEAEDNNVEELDNSKDIKIELNDISSDQHYEEEEEEQSIFHIEQKICTVCKLEQPLRTKHCRNCNRCVATYDHHCPWIGNCVAEKNRSNFFMFLSCQFVESLWAFIYFVKCFVPQPTLDEWVNSNLLSLLGTIITAFFMLMVGSLFFIHLFLISNNLTTWEFLSWNKISYMKIWPKRYGSPFGQNKSLLDNWRMYFCPFSGRANRKNYFISWKMPKQFPNIPESDIRKYKNRICCRSCCI